MTEEDPYYPLSARPKNDKRSIDGKAGDESQHGLLDDQGSTFDIAKTVVSNKSLKNSDDPTIGSQEYDNRKSATDFTKAFDPNNTAGAIPFALNLINTIKSGAGGNKVPSDIMGNQLFSLIQQVTQGLKLNNQQLITIALAEIQKLNDNRS